MGYSAPTQDIYNTPLHLRLREHSRRGNERLQDRGPGCLLLDSIFQTCQGNCTHKISTTKLPAQDLHKITPVNIPVWMRENFRRKAPPLDEELQARPSIATEEGRIGFFKGQGP